MKPITRYDAIRHVEANARLSGVELDAKTLKTLREYGTGRISMDELNGWLQTQLALVVLDRVPAAVPEDWDNMPD